jgi:hypothetical protein
MRDRRWYLLAVAGALLFAIIYTGQRDLLTRYRSRIETSRKLAESKEEAAKLKVEFVNLDRQIKELEKTGSTLEKERLIRHVKKYVHGDEIVFHLEPLNEIGDAPLASPAPEVPVPLPVPDPEAKNAGAPSIVPLKKK